MVVAAPSLPAIDICHVQWLKTVVEALSSKDFASWTGIWSCAGLGVAPVDAKAETVGVLCLTGENRKKSV